MRGQLGAAVMGIWCGSVLLGCPPDDLPDQDKQAPRVAGIVPSGRAVRTGESIVVEFTEPMIKGTLNAESIVVALTSDVNDAFISDFNNPPLSTSRDLVPLALAIADDGRRVTISATGGFPTAAELTLLVNKTVTDAAYNPLVGADGLQAHFRYDFSTDDGPPSVTLTDLAAQVPPNQRAITVVFDQPVFNVTTTTLTLRAASGSDPMLQSIELDAARLRATLRLADTTGSGCYTLCPLTSYTLSASAQIVDADGAGLQPYQQTVQTLADPDLASPRLLTIPPLAIAGEDSAQIQWETDKPASSAVRLGDAPNALTRRVVGAPGIACTGTGTARRCNHVVDVDGLDLGSGSGRTYYYVVESLDALNNPPLLAGPFSFSTQSLPKLAINEVYPNPPPGPNGEAEANYEFVEIVNHSDVDSYDLTGFSLREIDGTAALDLAPMQDGGPTMLAAGGYAVVGARDRFDAAALTVPAEALLLTDANRSRTTLLGGIKNSYDTRKRLGLYKGAASESAAPLISSYGAPGSLYSQGGNFLEGVSAERLLPTAPDVDTSWCYSSSVPTAGKQNSVYGRSACP